MQYREIGQNSQEQVQDTVFSYMLYFQFRDSQHINLFK